MQTNRLWIVTDIVNMLLTQLPILTQLSKRSNNGLVLLYNLREKLAEDFSTVIESLYIVHILVALGQRQDPRFENLGLVENIVKIGKEPRQTGLEFSYSGLPSLLDDSVKLVLRYWVEAQLLIQ